MLGKMTDSIFYGHKTVAFGTVIQQLIRPFRGARTKITELQYTAGGTAHTGTVRMPIGKTQLNAAAAASQTVVVLRGQPTAARVLAANDYLVIERQDSSAGTPTSKSTAVTPAGTDIRLTYELYKVSSVVVNTDGTLSVTLTGNVAAAHQINNVCWLMSLDTDQVPGYGQAGGAGQGQEFNPTFRLTASTTVTFPSTVAGMSGLVSTVDDYEPLLFEANNATATGHLEHICAAGVVVASGRP